MSEAISWTPPNRRMIANVSDTQYDVVLQVCEDILGWKLIFEKEFKDWDLYWTDSSVSTEMLQKMKSHQKINHFPGMSALSRKNTLAKNMRKMQEIFHKQYSFFPNNWLLPQDINSFKRYLCEVRNSNKRKFFIVKPQASSQGRGIYLTHSDNQFRFSEPCVVQQYLSNPLLFDDLKFDLRVYVLVAGCDPLRLYIYNEGLVRFSTEQYQYPTDDNLSNLFMHLTNYAINKKHPGFIQNQSDKNINSGHKRSLAEFFKTLRQKGINSAYIWSQIKDIAIKTLISAQPHLSHEYRVGQPNNILNNMCFEILGFDFLIQKDEKVFLLEVNHSPSFKCDSPLDHLLKTNVIADTIQLMNINLESRNDLLYEAFVERDIRIKTGRRITVNKMDKSRLSAEFQQFRNQFQDQHCGSYERIYPSPDLELQTIYAQLLQYATSKYQNSGNNGIMRKRFTYQNLAKNYLSVPKRKPLITQEQQNPEKQQKPKIKNFYDVSLPRLQSSNHCNAQSPLLSGSKNTRANSRLQIKHNDINFTQFSRGPGQIKMFNDNLIVNDDTTMFSRHYKR